jgi:hypothetical protein
MVTAKHRSKQERGAMALIGQPGVRRRHPETSRRLVEAAPVADAETRPKSRFQGKTYEVLRGGSQ